MAKEIILSAVAEQDYETILDYIFNKFGKKVVVDFIERFEEVCLLISHDAQIYPYLDKTKQIRKCVVTKHNVIYFKEYDTTIRIITIFDTRQNPHKLNQFCSVAINGRALLIARIKNASKTPYLQIRCSATSVSCSAG